MSRRLLLLLGLATGLAAGGWWLLHRTGSPRYKLYSPDLQYSVVAAAYWYEQFLPKMPGQSGDAAGEVVLRDEDRNEELAAAAVPMVSLADEVQWTDSMVYFIGDDYPNILRPWKLPRPLRKARVPYQPPLGDSLVRTPTPGGR